MKIKAKTHKKHLMTVSTCDTHWFGICNRTDFCSRNSQYNNSLATKQKLNVKQYVL